MDEAVTLIAANPREAGTEARSSSMPSGCRAEFNRLFPDIAQPPRFDPESDPLGSHAKLEAAANAALLNLRNLGGWIQGLIDELTLEKRLRMEAEEKAKLEARPATGFASGAADS